MGMNSCTVPGGKVSVPDPGECVGVVNHTAGAVIQRQAPADQVRTGRGGDLDRLTRISAGVS